MFRLRLNKADRLFVATHMQHAGKGCHAIQLLMAHDAQVVDITFYLTQLGAERVNFVAIAKGDHPALE
ncbi:hypothetical protein D3C87_1868630 [compost metagenome]